MKIGNIKWYLAIGTPLTYWLFFYDKDKAFVADWILWSAFIILLIWA